MISSSNFCASILSLHISNIKLYFSLPYLFIESKDFLRHLIFPLLALLSRNLKCKVPMEIDICLRSVIFTNHVVFIDDFQESKLDSIKLAFELGNVFFLGLLKLFHDLLLSVNLTVKDFILCHSFIQGGLEFCILSSKYINLPLSCLKFDFSIFSSQ